MPFVPHTEDDVKSMLETIGVPDIETLFDEIPESLKHAPLDDVPEGISEMELNALMKQRAKADGGMLSFVGAGAYEHHIPAAVWDLASRGEFYTAYTPYQAEASQGTLQLIYEYQSMMSSLMALDVSNASMYDGATALTEAVLMAVRLSKKKGGSSILLPRTLHPYYRETVQTIIAQQNIKIIDLPYHSGTGQIDQAALDELYQEDAVALVIPQPNFFGVLDDVDGLSRWARGRNLLTIAVVNPMAMALLKPPGEWGDDGVDIACGEGQPLGIPVSSGGPYYGFLCCKKAHVRQLPGRLVGRTVDSRGHEGFVLTLQAREQHIRRSKATSNICTNQGLMVTASTIYMSLLGPEGLRRVAMASHSKARQLAKALLAVPGITQAFSTPFFHELVLKVDKPVDALLTELAKKGIQGGFALQEVNSDLSDCILLCATETKTTAEIDLFAKEMQSACCSKAIA